MRAAAGMIVLLAVFLFVAGCSQTAASRRFTGEFQQIPLSEAPADLQALYERMKVAPGLFVLQRGGQTYLLLCAGKIEGGEQRVEVLEVAKPSGFSKEIRVLAGLRRGQGAGEYPHAVIRLEGAADLQFKARLNNRTEQVLELQGLPIVDR